MKCLEKDRDRRYEMANGLAADLRCFLNDEPIEACPPSKLYRMSKFARRNRRTVAWASAFSFVTMAGLAVGAWRCRGVCTRGLGRSTRAVRSTNQFAKKVIDELYFSRVEGRVGRDARPSKEDEATLDTAVRFYEEFAEQNRTDPALRREVSVAYRRAADIHDLCDRTSFAKKAVLKALISEQLVQRSPDDADLNLELCIAWEPWELMRVAKAITWKPRGPSTGPSGSWRPWTRTT